MLVTVISFILVLGLLVLVHELGHFLVARRAGVKVDEFGLGFPPRAIGFYRDPQSHRWIAVGPKVRHAPATIYSLNWFPLGGFVRIKGEQGEQSADPDSFAHKTIGRRIWIISAGVTMNVIAAWALLTFGYAIGLPQVLTDIPPRWGTVSDVKIQIVDVVVGLPAAEHGLRLGDSLVSLDGNQFTTLDAVQEYLGSRAGNAVEVVVDRAGKEVKQTMTPTILPGTGRAGLGIQLVSTGLVRYPLPVALVVGAQTTGQLMVEIVKAFGGVFVRLVQLRPVSVELSGPVGIAVLSGEVVRLGFRYLLQFTALLSLNLAIINFLPFPALDGGRVLFLVIERLRGRAVSSRLEATLHNIGFALLMLLVLFITYRDIAKLVTRGAGP